MKDRELLEAAAKAAGIKGEWGEKIPVGDTEVDCTDMFFVGDYPWNPLDDSHDAMELMVSAPLLAGFDLQYALAIAWQACNTAEERAAHVRRLIVETAARAAAALSGVKE